MKVETEKSVTKQSRAFAGASSARQVRAGPEIKFEDRRPEIVGQRELAGKAASSPQSLRIAQLQAVADGSVDGTVQRAALEEDELLQGKFKTIQRQGLEEEELLQGRFETIQKVEEEEELLQGRFETIQRQGPEEEELLQGKFETIQKQEEEEELQMKSEPVQRQKAEGDEEILKGEAEAVQRAGKEVEVQAKSAAVKKNEKKATNNTGLPDNLKSGIENLSGFSLNDVKVHYNSPKPAQLQAHAFAQGTDIHLGAGQEKHLHHESWHVVQQKQGRVKPTMQMKGKVNINDDAGLEKEADVMGKKALTMRNDELKSHPLTEMTQIVEAEGLVQLAPLNNGKLNLVGESHFKDPKRKAAEKAYGERLGGGNYWPEKSFRYGADSKRGDPDKLIIGYRIDRFKRHINDLETSYEISDVKGMLKYCKRLSNDLNNADKFPDQGKKAPMQNSLVKLENWAQGLKDSWDADHSDLKVWQSLVNRKLLFIKPEYDQLNKKYEAITQRNSERDAIESRYARSDAMWIGAAKGGKTGLWKIGQNHVDDIKMLHAEYKAEGTYKKLRGKFEEEVKMQSKGDFETEFQAWWTRNEGEFPR